MLDTRVIAACVKSRKAYEAVKDHLNKEDLSPQGELWLPLIHKWYSLDENAERVDKSLLREQGKRKFDPRHKDMLLEWWDDLPTVSISPSNVVQDVLELKRHQQGLVLCADIQKLTSTPEKLIPKLEEYIELCKCGALDSSDTKEADFASMLEVVDQSHKLAVAPSALNKKLNGGAVPGDFILVFARPEVGKSLFVVNMACGFAKMGHSVLYIGNEESISKTYMRMTCNLLRCTEEQVFASPEKAKALADKRGLGRIKAIHMTPGTVREIEELVVKYKPKVLVVDQIRNISSSGDSLTTKLESVGRSFRNMIGKHGVVGVFVTQAGDRAGMAGQKQPLYLTMSDIDSSRTGLPACADLIVGVGTNEELRRQNTRAVSLPKNKLGNDHSGFLVQVDEEKSRVN